MFIIALQMTREIIQTRTLRCYKFFIGKIKLNYCTLFMKAEKDAKSQYKYFNWES